MKTLTLNQQAKIIGGKNAWSNQAKDMRTDTGKPAWGMAGGFRGLF